MERETKEFFINEDMKPIREDDDTGSEYNDEEEECETGSEYNDEKEDCEEEDNSQYEQTSDGTKLLNQDLQICRCSDVIIQRLTIVFIMQFVTLGFMVFS